MLTADKIGLLPILDLLAGHSYWVTIILCLSVTPIALYVIGAIFESRKVPILPNKQFASFIPGDIFLSFGVCGGLVLAQQLPDGYFWYNSSIFHVAALIITLTVAVAMYMNELINAASGSQFAFTVKAMKSPTKIYHDFALYGLLGYVAGTTYIALIVNVIKGGIPVATLLGSMWPIFVWLLLLFTEGLWPEQYRLNRVRFAHVEDWKPIWRD